MFSSHYNVFNDEYIALKFLRVANSCSIKKYDPLQIFLIKLLNEHYTCGEIGLAPGSTLFHRLPFIEYDSFSYCTVEVVGIIFRKIK